MKKLGTKAIMTAPRHKKEIMKLNEVSEPGFNLAEVEKEGLNLKNVQKTLQKNG